MSRERKELVCKSQSQEILFKLWNDKTLKSVAHKIITLECNKINFDIIYYDN